MVPYLADKMDSMWAVLMVDQMVVCLAYCLVAHWVCESADWLVGWMALWMVAYLADKMASI